MAKKRGNGEGSITKRKDGTWMGRVTTGRNDDGKLKRQCVYGRTRSEVSEKMNKIISELNTGTYMEPTRMTLAEWLNTWLWDYKKQSLKPASFMRYEICVRVHIVPVIGKMLLRDVRPMNIQKLINSSKDRNQSCRSIKYIYTTLHNAFDLALKNGLVSSNVCKSVVLPKQEKKEIKILTIEEQDRFMEVIKGHRFELAFIIDLFTGLRLSELLALKWSSIDFDEGVIRVSGNIQRVKNYENSEKKTKVIHQTTTKTKAGKRTIPLLDELVELLKQHREVQEKEKEIAEGVYNDDGYIFCNPLGQCLEPRRMIEYFNTLAGKAGLGKVKMPRGWKSGDPLPKKFKFPKWFSPPEGWKPGESLPLDFKLPEGINFHALRHTFASRGLEKGINPKIMQELLGHSSIIMTLDLYSHVLPDTKKEAINKLKEILKKPEKPEK